MKRVCLGAAKRIIVVLVFLAGAVLPVYSQEMQAYRVDADRVSYSRLPLSAGEKPAFSVSQETGSRFPLSAGETPAVPENETTGTLNPPTSSQTPSASQTPTASPTPAASPSTGAPYVFPTGGERFNRYVKSTVGPFSLLRIGFSAGINQWRDNPEEWEQGMSGYGKRYASGFGRNAIQQTVIYGLDSAMGLDTGFKRSTRTGFFPRLKDALAENITSRTRTGKRVISVPRITGVYASRIIAYEAWYPERYDYKDALRSGTRSILTGFGMNLIREFVVKF